MPGGQSYPTTVLVEWCVCVPAGTNTAVIKMKKGDIYTDGINTHGLAIII